MFGFVLGSRDGITTGLIFGDTFLHAGQMSNMAATRQHGNVFSVHGFGTNTTMLGSSVFRPLVVVVVVVVAVQRHVLLLLLLFHFDVASFLNQFVNAGDETMAAVTIDDFRV